MMMFLLLACVPHEGPKDDLPTDPEDTDTAAPDTDDPDTGDTDTGDTDTDTSDSGDTDSGDSDTDTTDSGDTDEPPDTGPWWDGEPETRSLALADATVRDVEDRYFSWAVLGAGDINGDGYDDLVTNDPMDGEVWVFAGPLAGEVSVSDAWATWRSAGNAMPGELARVGDVDGDGLADFLVGAYYETTMGGDAGAVYEARGTATGGAFDLRSMATVYGEEAESYAGAGIAGVGDLDGDGAPDVGIGTPDYRGARDGAVSLLHAPLVGGLETAFATFGPEGPRRDLLGEEISGPGDIDGDGADDLVLASEDTNEVFVFYGPVAGDYTSADYDLQLTGEGSGDAFGTRVEAAGDQDGDGVADVAVSAQYADGSSGTIYVFSRPGTGSVGADTAMGQVWGESGGCYVGESYDLGDLDGDGVEDLVAGSGGNGVDYTGRAYVVFGPLTRGLDLSDAAFEYDGVDSYDGAGHEVAFLGDLDADGLGDFAIAAGAAFHPVDRGRYGAVYIVYGGSL